ncbi:MAG: uracil-DNA glycosylase [Candidatus Anoxymicrobium japonicum]|uniref:Type-4 uracil-DNA glycosylase n=1 Tax=Candidatus Anoxymicrobium japonicum TaxID=2013648 RepID=A0A2N3G466_9ACTN|nr:MAG: uracil-DNA glycosylase [Candidatus Anoxymicrobium japonicum]
MYEADSLEELQKKLRECTRCPLHEGRGNLVFGAGNPDARLMFVGEAPGRAEDAQGIPFVGPAGKLLDELLRGIGLERADVYIANVVKCRPPGNRDPLPLEVETCKPFLREQIKLVRPEIICELGRVAAGVMMQRQIRITSVHGKKFPGSGYFHVPVFHPAAALRARETMQLLRQDFANLNSYLEEEAPSPTETTPEPERARAPESEPEQMELF